MGSLHNTNFQAVREAHLLVDYMPRMREVVRQVVSTTLNTSIPMNDNAEPHGCTEEDTLTELIPRTSIIVDGAVSPMIARRPLNSSALEVKKEMPPK